MRIEQLPGEPGFLDLGEELELILLGVHDVELRDVVLEFAALYPPLATPADLDGEQRTVPDKGVGLRATDVEFGGDLVQTSGTVTGPACPDRVPDRWSPC